MSDVTTLVSPDGVSYLEMWIDGVRWVAPLGTPATDAGVGAWLQRPADWTPDDDWTPEMREKLRRLREDS